MYVTWLVQRSALAHAIASELLAPGYDDILDQLRDPENPNTAGPAFAAISDRLRSALEFDALRPLVEADLTHLAHRAVWEALAPILRCRAYEVLASLIDQVALKRSLDEAGWDNPAVTEGADAEKLYLLMLHKRSGIEALSRHNAISPNSWGTLMEIHRWIWPGAAERLRAEAALRGWAKGSEPVRPTEVLAAVIDETLKPPTWRVGPEEDQFGPIAVVSIRRRTAHLVDELREEAIEQAELAAPFVTTLLPAWIDLYERQAIVPALMRLKGPTIHVKDLLAGARVEPQPVTADIDPTTSLTVQGQVFPKGILRREYATFDVICPIESGALRSILKVTALPKGAYEIIKPRIEQLHGSDLVPTGGTLGNRLLATPVTRPDRLTEFLRTALERHSAKIAQTLVLSGVERPITVPIPWREDLNDRLPYAKRDPASDVTLPVGINDTARPDGTIDVGIVNRMRARCQEGGKNPEVVHD